jgi:hypothetical protein
MSNKENQEHIKGYCKRMDNLTKILKEKQQELDRVNALLSQFRDAKSFEEWRTSPVPLSGDGNTPKSLENCLEAMFYFLKDDLEPEVNRTKWHINEVDEMQVKDHEMVLDHEEKLDDVVEGAARMKMYLRQIQLTANIMDKEERDQETHRQLEMTRIEMRALLKTIDDNLTLMSMAARSKNKRLRDGN